MFPLVSMMWLGTHDDTAQTFGFKRLCCRVSIQPCIQDEGEEEDENQEIGGGGGDVDNAEQGMSGGENIGGRHRAKCDTPDRARRDSRVTSVGGEEGSDDCPSKPTRRGRTKRSSSGADPGGRGGKGRELLKRTGESVDDVSLALDVSTFFDLFHYGLTGYGGNEISKARIMLLST